jgi:hypothetical protein
LPAASPRPPADPSNYHVARSPNPSDR